MDKMRLVDANAIKYREKDEYCGNGNSRPVRYVFDEDIAKLPTVDAVEVVRCKDCKYWSGYGGRCKHWGSPLAGTVHYTRAEDFCSYGERRNDVSEG